MATADLASLVIGLRADVAQLQSDLGKATSLHQQYAKQASDVWNRAGDSIRDSLSDLAGKVVAAFAVDRLVDFGAKAIEAADQIGKMAQKVGVSVESLSALQTQAKLSNVETDQLQSGLAKLAKNATDAAGGSKESAAAFSAMGVSLRDSNGNLKSTQQLLQDVAAKFAGYEDSASKTALAQRLFGKSGADLIPILNQLGEQGFAKATEEAQKYGQVISGATAKQANEFNDNLTKLSLAASGFANAVAREALPDLVRLTDQMAQSATTSDGYASSAQNVAKAVVIIAENVATLINDIVDLPSEISKTADQFEAWAKSVGITNGQIQTLIDLIPKIPKPATGGGLISVDIREGSAAGYATQFISFLAHETGLVDEATTKTNAFRDAMRGVAPNVNTASNALGGLAQHVDGATQIVEKAKAPIIDLGKSTADSLQHAQDQAAKFLASINGIGADKYTKALAEYNAKLAEADKIFNQLVDSGASATDALNFIAEATGKLKSGLDDQVQAMRNANDATAILSTSYARAESDINNQIRLLGLDKESREADELATRLTIAALGDLKDFMGPLTVEQQALIDKNNALAHSFVTQKTAIDQSKEMWQGWVSIIQGAGQSVADTFAKALFEGGSFLKSLGDIAKQVVEQIISYFLKLAVINPILNAVFGGVMGAAGGSLLPTFASAAGGLVSDGVGVSGGTTVAGGSFNLFSAGQTMWSGFQKGLDGLYASGGIGNSFLGTVNYGDFGNTFTPSGFTYGAAAAGGLYAGYNEFQNAGGGAAGVLGGAAYGYGTYAAGIGVSAALAGGLSAGLAAIPVVGWIAIAAMLIDKFSGGKLFGTKGSVQEGSSTLSIGAGGADFANQVSLKGQKALFGGAKWSTQDIPETPEQKQAAQAFFDSMTKTMGQYAGQFGVKAGDLVSATFQTVFDKKGNPTGVTHANIAGYNYDNLTQDQFAQAYVSANELSVLDQFDSKLESVIGTFRQTADGLNQIAAGLTNAQGYLQAGGDFLAISGKDTLSSIVTLAEGMQAAGETIDQTIGRLIQAQQQYDQFVSQFKPAPKYVDDFEQSLSQINQQMLANIKQANDLAKAAGAAGASEQDLANIHKYAAEQAAQAIAALQASAQSLAFSLGLTTVGTLDQVNSEIASLESKANQGSSAVRNFGTAMTSAADAAKNAADLLLGALSPLNDQQKLQYALSHAGSVTQQQVLEIGRRLYGSTEQYNQLFNMTQHMAFGQGAAAGGVGGGTIPGGSGGLSDSDRARLKELYAEQKQLQDAATLQQYRTLAQQIAEIASAKGEDWRQVLDEMGINISDFEKGLHMSDQQTSDFIDSIQKQTDSFGDSTASLIAALNANTLALGGTPPGDSSNGGGTSGGSGSSTDPRATGHGGHSIPPRDYGREVGRGIGDVINLTTPRSGRQQSNRSTARV